MKDNKGFTLVELMAIILVIAIISVITVPIIIDTLEESTLGATTSSAYGYKDSVNGVFSNRLFDGGVPGSDDGVYSINSQGNIVKGTAKPIVVKSSGKKPNGGSILVRNDEIKNACFQFSENIVLVIDGEIGEATNGNCSEYDVNNL